MQRGTIVLIVLLLIISFIPRIYYYFLPEEDFKVVLLAEDYDESFREQATQKKSMRQKGSEKSSPYRVPKRAFDPNQYTLNDWMELGLTEKQAQSILNFNKFGFYSHRDIQKHFLFKDSTLFYLLKDSLIYPSKGKVETEVEVKKVPVVTLLDVNNASIEELVQLPGIGEYTAKQILFQREKLGGFVSIEQLKEVKGLREENYERMKNRIKVDLATIKKININECSVNDLSKHPYISHNVANSIVKIRAKYGKYTSVSQIKESELIDDELYRKLIPYLFL